MSQQISTFGQHPAANAQPGAEPSPTSGNRRTVVLAVTGAVVALGMLGGAVALALSPDDDGTDLTAPLPAATASAEPSVEPSVEPTAPLPTAAVQGRNIFVPLLAQAAVEGAAGADSVAEADSRAAQETAARSAAEQAENAREVAALRNQVSSLQAQLTAESDDSALDGRLADLQDDYDALLESVVVVTGVTVEDLDADDVLTLDVDGTTVRLDTDPATELPRTTDLGVEASDGSVVLEYLGADVQEGPRTVLLKVASTLYTLEVGAAITVAV